MSETTGAGTMNPPDRPKIGSAGKPVRDLEMMLAEDGEILVRGPVMMSGYRNLPDATTEAYDEDGWFRTGDVGEFDDDGYLRIVDRKKELIINAAGKNMSPANIESALKSASPLIGQACVIGDRRPYNTALLVLDQEYAPAWAAQLGLDDVAPHQLAAQRARAGGRAGRRGPRERLAVARRADQALRDPAGGLAARGRRAHADDEAQAQADRDQVRGRDRGHVRRGEVIAAARERPLPWPSTG